MYPMIGDYLRALTRRLPEVQGAWVVGSSALGDFDAARSDIDVQALATRRLSRGELEALAASLSALPCPVRGLEFVLYGDLHDPLGPAFQLNLNTGPGMEHHEGYDATAEPRFWFTLDVAIAREHAQPLRGPHPRELLPELPRPLVVRALRESLDWWEAFGGAQAVLAACRAWAWAVEGHWLSKGNAGAWAAARLDDPARVLEALAD